MNQNLSEPASKKILGVYGKNTYRGEIRADEFLTELKGKKAIRKYREMRDNNATIGAVLYATEQVLRDVKIKVVPSVKVDLETANKEVEFIESVFDDMDHSLDDHISEALSMLTYGFCIHEVVYKRREGVSRSEKKDSKYTDGRIGIKKLAIRAPWTIEEFDVDPYSGEVVAVRQEPTSNHPGVTIPIVKTLYYRTTSLNNDPSGRSILRNAYQPYTYLNKIQAIEAIAVERELHGIPIGRMPAEYLSSDASNDQVALRESFQSILRDLKNNEQGYALLPSDLYVDTDGKPTTQRLMDIELITSNGSRSIDIDPIIKRYQHDIARSVMAEFMMLGGGSTGSYALSKSKTDLFLRSMESYINTIVDVLNRQLIERLWELNGLPFETMPKLVAGDVAAHDLKEIAAFLRNLNGAEISVADDPDTVKELMDIAELPFDKEAYIQRRTEAKRVEEENQNLERQALMREQDNMDEEDTSTEVKEGKEDG